MVVVEEEEGGGRVVGVAEGVEEGEMRVGDEREKVFGDGFETEKGFHWEV